MQFNFFPSRRLTLYLAKLFIVRIAAMLAVLVLVLMMLDMLSNSGKILAVEGNGQAEILRYVSYRVPQLIQSFLPYSVLLATLITLVALNQHSEVIAMKAAGLSAHQVLAPLLLTAGVISVVSFAFNETVVTQASAKLKAWEGNEFGALPDDAEARSNIFLSDGKNVLTAKMISGSGRGITMENVTWYERSDGGLLIEQIDAERAVFAAPGWRLEGAEKFRVATARGQSIAPIVVGRRISIEQIELNKVDADTMNIWQLRDSIQAYDRAGRKTDKLRAKWWHKISGPASAFLMPLLGAVAAFGLARSGQLLLRGLIGMSLGFAYFVVDNAAMALGNFGGYPPLLAAWAPFVLFLLIGETVLIRTEE